MRIDFTLSRNTPGQVRSEAMRVRGMGSADIDGSIESGDFSMSPGGVFCAASGSYAILGALSSPISDDADGGMALPLRLAAQHGIEIRDRPL